MGLQTETGAGLGRGPAGRPRGRRRLSEEAVTRLRDRGVGRHLGRHCGVPSLCTHEGILGSSPLEKQGNDKCALEKNKIKQKKNPCENDPQSLEPALPAPIERGKN